MILGLNTSHDCSFCLLDDSGRPIYILEEERFNRIKHTGFTTLISVETLIREGRIKPDEVSDLVYSFEMEPKLTSRLMDQCYENVVRSFGPEVLHEARQYFNQPEHGFSPTRGLGLHVDFDEAASRLRSMFPSARESSYKHHLCHAASAYYPSPFESAAVIVLDGSGRLETTTIWQGRDRGLTLLHEIDLPHSIGILYWLFSQYIGLEEGQTMGLAAYGQPVYEKLLYDHVIAIDEERGFAFKAPIVSWFDMDSEYAIRIIENLFGVKARRSHREPLTQFHADVAASIQRVTEEVLLKVAFYARRVTGEANLCLAGGVIQNCVANGRLVCEGVFDQVWIQPMASDCGTALGGALYHHYRKRPDEWRSRWRMSTAQLGLGYDNQYIESCLERVKIPYRKSAVPANEAAEDIANGKIIGWFQSCAEVGPRALGGRSILADARSRFNQFTVNQIKDRQPWRPFAPSILQDQMGQYFDSTHRSPYMILSFSLSATACLQVPAICHADGSARVQTVSTDGGAYYDLLARLYELTGIPVVLNTSFNLKAEPIVQHPLEAIRDFLISGIDSVFIGNFVIDEKPVVEPLLIESLAASPFVSLYDAYLRNSRTLFLVKHEILTIRQCLQRNHLRAILDWLGISYREVLPSDLEYILSSDEDGLDLLSIAPLPDEKLLRELPRTLIEKVRISLLDREMFMAQTTAIDFLDVIRANRLELQRLTDGRSVVVWAEGDDLNEIIHDLSYLGVGVSRVISARSNLPSKTKQDSGFLIVSFSMMDEFKSELRLLGYHSGFGYLVWDA